MINKFTLFVFAFFMTSSFVIGQNPIKKDFGMADPHCYIFNNKAYLFTTRDEDPKAKGFVMPDWQIWSSNDLVDWKLQRTILPTETYMGKSTKCWATETATKNGKYYFYFSNGNINTGVMVADKPEGPYKDALGKPMLDVDLTSTKEYDPTVLVDDDDKAYIIFGHHVNDDKNLNWYIAKLNEDMISLAEQPNEIVLENVVDYMKANDKPNLHKRNGIYYLSAGTHYATSKNVYGPYTVVGSSGNNKYGLDSRAHGNYFSWNNQWFHTWCHFYLGKEVAYFRESYINYLHYKDDGSMVDDVDYLDAHFATGVGQYDANWDFIQAEWYMKATGLEKKECPSGGFEIQKTQNNATLIYPNIKNLEHKKSINFYLSSENGGLIEIHDKTAKGKLLGSCKIPKTGNWSSYQNVKTTLTNLKGVKDLCLVFKGNTADIAHLDRFQFN